MNQNLLIIIILKLAAGAVIALGMMSFAMVAHGAQVFDTTYAVEASSSCLSGGCHETNATLVTGYKASYMTHVMVKCNACHGTHTAAELGKPKPNLTGYISGMGATGYKVPRDRCLACHSSMLSSAKHPKNSQECLSCHTPHIFAPPGNK
jgi:Cytochrome c554 and c-prime